MTGQIDQISAAIGALQADARTARDEHTQTANTLKNITEKLDLLLPVVKDVAEMKPHIEDYKRLKQRGLGIIAGVGLTGGGFGAALTHWLGRW